MLPLCYRFATAIAVRIVAIIEVTIEKVWSELPFASVVSFTGTITVAPARGVGSLRKNQSTL